MCEQLRPPVKQPFFPCPESVADQEKRKVLIRISDQTAAPEQPHGTGKEKSRHMTCPEFIEFPGDICGPGNDLRRDLFTLFHGDLTENSEGFVFGKQRVELGVSVKDTADAGNKHLLAFAGNRHESRRIQFSDL